MRDFFRVLILLFTVIFSGNVFASVSPSITVYGYSVSDYMAMFTANRTGQTCVFAITNPSTGAYNITCNGTVAEISNAVFSCPSNTTFNLATQMCDSPLPPPPAGCSAGSVLNTNTNMCQQITGGCVTVTRSDGTTATSCDTVPPLVCPAGKTPGTANGILMCAGGSPLPLAAAPAPVAGYAGPTVAAGTSTTTNNYTSTTTTTSSGSTTTGSSTMSGSMSVDLSPVVGAVNQTTAAVDATAKAVADNGMAVFCQNNPKALACQAVDFNAPNGAGASTSGLYTPDSSQAGKTLSSVYNDFITQIKASPVMSGVSGFFNISVPAGSCGGMSISVPTGFGVSYFIDLDSVLCSSTTALIYQALYFGLMFGALWAAFKIAFL